MPRPPSASDQASRTHFGKLLDYYRVCANLSMAEVAKRAGVKTRTLDFYRTGERHPREKQLAVLCDALGLVGHNRAVLVAAARYSRDIGPDPFSRPTGDPISQPISDHVPTFGKLLAQYRLHKGLTQVDLADQVGCTERFIQKLEAGDEHPGTTTLQQLRTLFNLPDDEWMAFANAASGLPLPPTVPGLPTPPIYDPGVPTLIGLDQVVGRAADQAELMRRLMTNRQPATVALVGLPGMGKTTLASVLAHDPALRNRWMDGVLWASLGKDPHITENLVRWAYLLRLPAPNAAALTLDTWKEWLREIIGDRHLLLIIDDAWRFKDAEAFFAGGPNCATLVTTRLPSVAYEMVGQEMYVLDGLDAAAGQQLLRVHAPVLTTHATPDTAKAEQALLGWAGGLPLALSLLGRHVQAAGAAAASGPHLASDQVSEAINAAVKDLESASKRINVTQRDLLTGNNTSLHIVIVASERWLSSAIHGAALRALAVFPPKTETFSREAALAVSDAPEEVLDALVTAGMLERDAGGRFALHQSVHDYLAHPALLKPAMQRAIAYFLEFAERHAHDGTAMAGEMPGLLVTLQYATDLGAWDELIRLTLICAPRAQLMGMHTEVAPWLEKAITAAREMPDERALIELLHFQARNLDHAARSREAVDVLREALALNEQRHDDLLTITLLITLGNISNKTDDLNAFEDARGHLMRALTIAEELGNPALRCDILYNLSNTAFARGHYQNSLDYALEGLEIAHTMNDQQRISGMLSAAGNIMANLGRYEEAYGLLEQGANIAQQLGDPVREGYIRINLGVVAINQGRYREAEHLLKTVFDISERRGDRRHMAFALANLAQVSLARGELERAGEQLAEALKQAKSLHRRDRLTDIYLNLGMLEIERSQFARARAYLRLGREALGSRHYPEFEALLLCAEGECDLRDTAVQRSKTLESARGSLEQALAIAERLAHCELIGRVRNALGRLHLRAGDFSAALASFAATLATVREHREVIAEAHFGRALAAARGNDLDTARIEAQESLDQFDAIRHHHARDAKALIKRLAR